jgi:predicted dienelactone hydrolase
MVRAGLRRLLALALLGALGQAASAATGVAVLPAPPQTGPVTVFFPTAAPAARFVRGPFSFELASDAAPLRGNGHLVVMSHGSGGSPWPQADLAIALVDAGFTVAMPEHAGDNYRDMRDVGPATWRHRPREVSQAIDAVAADARFAPLLDLRHVGVYGMSAGGLTALTLAGARWSPALLDAHCQAHLAEDFPACVGLSTALTGGLLDGMRLAVARWVIHFKLGSQTTLESWTDPRITAAVAAVPMAATIDMGSIATPRIPLGLVRAGQDEWLAPPWHIDAVRAACAACVLIADMPTAGHGSILSPQPPDLPPAAARLLDDPPGFDRSSLVAVYGAIARFFVQNLAP